ncbi:MAG: histidinol dehydrogenase [Sphingobacteriales bacterium]|jgi:histidinol dehydrogenase
MRLIINPALKERQQLFQRPAQGNVPESVVKGVFDEIQQNGDVAIRRFTEKYDGIIRDNFRVGSKEIAEQAAKVSSEMVEALSQAIKNIRVFHQTQFIKPQRVMTMPGVYCWMESRPIERVGLYVPGGSAPLFSTLCMLVIPAQVAGVKEIILCTPPNKEGTIDPAMAWALQFLEVDDVCLVGGIQAIAGMAIGTKWIPKVQKIYGPGNQYVEAAKQFATKYNVAYDLPAGPSEVLVLADDDSNPVFVASDLLAQAEHDALAQVGVIARSAAWVEQCQAELKKQLEVLPRKEIAAASLVSSWFIVANSEKEQILWSNEYAPEHLIIHMDNAMDLKADIVNAGSVFLGKWTPESLGDYASGTNHTLPTYGWAKQYSGVSVFSFQKQITFQEAEPVGLENIGSTVTTLARGEGLEGHARAVDTRLEYLKSKAKN